MNAPPTMTVADGRPSTIQSGRLPLLPPVVLLGCFFLSGATGLVYEVIWLRVLSLVFGHTVYAITTVLAAFMAGLAVGSFLFGRRAPRIENLVRTYGWLEIGIGVYCALLPVLLAAAAAIYLGLHRTLQFSYDAFSLIQFLLIFALLLIPTTLMGATLPVLTQALARDDVGLGRTVGRLYAVNTLGAVIGVAAAGYVLIPAFGNRTTTLMAAAANVVVGTLAILYGRTRRAMAAGVGPGAGESERRPDPRPVPSGAPGLAVWMTVAALGVSGATSMLYEVAWTRALALVIGSSTYAFTAMLVAFLTGIAGGSALYSWLWGRRSASAATFAAIQAALGVTVLATLLVFERMPDLLLGALRWSDSPGFVQFVQVALSAIVLLPATLLIGATFPCVMAVAARGVGRAGRDVGHVYAVNTVGAIAGTVLAGFVLLPALGVHTSIKVGIVTNLLVATALLGIPPLGVPAWRAAGVAAALAATAGVYFVSPWNPAVMVSGPAIYAKRYLSRGQPEPLAKMVKSDVVFYRDGLSSTVSVHRNGPNISLRVNGKTDAGTSSDMPTQLMSGHLPMLFHAEPKTVLVIGLGSGITAGAVARYPIERLEIAEIEPAVVEASHFFAPWHGDVLKDPRVRTLTADGRNFLLTTSGRYDVIISEPSNPWIGGLASLFSVEFFELARQRLGPGGIMLQWVQGYNLLPDDLRMVVRTFRTVFPATSIWNTISGDFLLVGRVEPTPLDLKRVEARFQNEGIARQLGRIGVRTWPGILGYFMLGERDTARFSESAGLNTDDRLPLEFSAPRALYLDTVDRTSRLLRSFKTADFPEVTPESQGELERAETRYWVGLGYLRRNAPEDALVHFQRALELDPQHRPSMIWASAASLRAGRAAKSLELAKQVLDREPGSVEALMVAGLASGALNAPTQAVTFLERASRLDPQNGQIQQALTRAQISMLRGPSAWAGENFASQLVPR